MTQGLTVHLNIRDGSRDVFSAVADVPQSVIWIWVVWTACGVWWFVSASWLPVYGYGVLSLWCHHVVTCWTQLWRPVITPATITDIGVPRPQVRQAATATSLSPLTPRNIQISTLPGPRLPVHPLSEAASQWDLLAPEVASAIRAGPVW